MSKRVMSVYYTGVKDDYPIIKIQGKWLAMVGFKVGARFTVEVSQGQLILKLLDYEQPDK